MGFFLFRTDRRGHAFTGMACKIFDRNKLVPRKNSLRESVTICWDRTKQDWYYLLTSYRTRIKEPVIITRIQSSSNLLIFLVCFFCVVSCWLHASGAFFACCSTCNVLILSQIISECSMSSEIHHLQLRCALFLWLFFNGGWTFGESNNIKSFQISEFHKQSG